MKKIIITVIFICFIFFTLYAEWKCPDCHTKNADKFNYCIFCGLPKVEFYKKLVLTQPVLAGRLQGWGKKTEKSLLF